MRSVSDTSSQLQIVEFGPPDSLKYRCIYLQSGNIISPYHVIPLRPFLSPSDDSVSFICTSTAGLNIRHEIASNEPFTPLRVAKSGGGRVAQYANPAPWNCGVLPQTGRLLKTSGVSSGPATPIIKEGTTKKGLSAPASNESTVDCSPWGESDSGDGVPIEAIEFGGGVARRVGEVYTVKVLGSFGVMREGKSGRVEWKVVGIAADHRMAAELLDVADISRKMPGMLEEIREWFRVGEIESGRGGLTTFTPTEAPRGKALTAGLLAEAHTIWQQHHRTRRPPSALLPPGAPVTVATLAQAWLPYTTLLCEASGRGKKGEGEGKHELRSVSMHPSRSLDPPSVQRSISLSQGPQPRVKGRSWALTPRSPTGEKVVHGARPGVLQITPLSSEEGGGAVRKVWREVGSHSKMKNVSAAEWEGEGDVPMAMPTGKEWVGGGKDIAVARVVKSNDEWNGDKWLDLVEEARRTHSGSGGEGRGGRSNGEEGHTERHEKVRGGSQAGLRSGGGSQQVDGVGVLDRLQSLRFEIPESDTDPPRTDEASSRGGALTPSGRSGGGVGRKDVTAMSPGVPRHQNGATPRAPALKKQGGTEGTRRRTPSPTTSRTPHQVRWAPSPKPKSADFDYDKNARESRQVHRAPTHKTWSAEYEIERRSIESRPLSRSQAATPKSALYDSWSSMEEELRWAEQESAGISGTAAHRRSLSGGGERGVPAETPRKRNVRFNQRVEVVTFEDMEQ